MEKRRAQRWNQKRNKGCRMKRKTAKNNRMEVKARDQQRMRMRTFVVDSFFPPLA